VREAIAFLLLACACGAATLSDRHAEPQGHTEADPEASSGLALPVGSAVDEGAGPTENPSAARSRGFAALEARAPALAPGMDRVVERETEGQRVELLRATDRDLCLRVAYEASDPVVARLLVHDGTTLAETRAPAAEGALGERGPVCVRKGETVSAFADGASWVRWVVWGSR
jgi:hypothetical protein